MIIRQHHIQAITESRVERGNVALLTYIKERFPHSLKEFADANLLNGIRTVRATARSYGVTREDCLATFLDLAIVYGPDFHLADWAWEVLNCQALHAPDRMALLKYRVKQTGVDI